MTTFYFKTTEDIDAKSRTIVKEVPVPATTEKVEFTLEQKENELVSARKSVEDATAKVTELEAEIAEIKAALEIPLAEVEPVEAVK